MSKDGKDNCDGKFSKEHLAKRGAQIGTSGVLAGKAIGLSAIGPVKGAAFALAQKWGLVTACSLPATLQSIVMTTGCDPTFVLPTAALTTYAGYKLYQKYSTGDAGSSGNRGVQGDAKAQLADYKIEFDKKIDEAVPDDKKKKEEFLKMLQMLVSVQ